MTGHRGVAVAALAAAVVVGCAPWRGEPDAREELGEALAAARRAQACAAELAEAADADAGMTAALVGLEPAALAPFGGPGRGKEAVRAAIRTRATAARDAAGAARNLALLGDHASAQQQALLREKIAASVATSSALCGAAERLRGALLAQRREPPGR